MKSVWVGVVASAALVACSPEQAEEPHEDAHEAAAEHMGEHHAGHGAEEAMMEHVENLTVRDGKIRPLLGGKTVTAGYFTVVSPTDDALVGASADFAETIELHDHIMNDGMMQMRKVAQVDLPAHTPVSFKPHGLHLMIFGVTDLPEGEERMISLAFASGATVDVQFRVETP